MKENNNIDTAIVSNILENEKEYWCGKLANISSKTALPCGRYSITKEIGNSGIINFEFNEDICKKMIRLSRESDQNLFMVLYSVVVLLIYKYTNTQDIIVEVPINKQDDGNDYVNTRIPLLNQIQTNKNYKEILKEFRSIWKDAYDNGNYPINKIYDITSMEYSHLESPLTDIAILLENIHDPKYLEQIKYNIKFDFQRIDNKISLCIEYNLLLYKEEEIMRMCEHLNNISNSILSNFEIKISEIDIMSQNEKQKLIKQFNATDYLYPTDKTIHELFENQVKNNPNNIAVIFEDEKLTYNQLNEKANKLAVTLRKKGVKNNSIVGVMIERSLEAIIAIVAILKAGGAYLPIDVDCPEERIKSVLEDSKTKILLVKCGHFKKIKFDGEILDLEDSESYSSENINIKNISSPEDLAYIIYTSGSTGKPKGVMVRHRNVVNLIFAFSKSIYRDQKYSLNFSMISPYYFDASIKQLFPSLTLGHTLHIIKKDISLNGTHLCKYYKDNLIDIADGTPTHLNMLLNSDCKFIEDTKIKYFIIGGEVLKPELAKSVIDKFNSSIVNVYGPTECCDVSTMYILNNEMNYELNNIPIGKPISNAKIFILNNRLELCPIGVQGELCISGDGLSKGYLNDEKLNAEKFIEHPLANEERIYRTGDLARWLPDGNIEFLGRIGYQVKIRGFRIELGEIESQLLKYELIKEAVVIDREDANGDRYLCAYIVGDKEIRISGIKKYLAEKLPEYMIPIYYMEMERIPLNRNGKLDRAALPEPDKRVICKEGYEAPRNEIEEKLSQIWCSVLGVDKVGINDDFFELGGHSIKATILISRIHKELNLEIPLSEIFNLKNIKSISKFIEEINLSRHVSIEKAEEQEYYEASSAQKRIYMLQQLESNSASYNIPRVLMIEGKIDKKKLEDVFKELIHRHESLRTSFESINEEVIQRVNENVEFKIDYLEKPDTDVEIEESIKKFIRPFDLAKAPLTRVGIMELQEDKSILIFDVHHIISDGTSTGILIDEFSKLYNGEKLGQLRIQYKDYAVWKNKLLESGEIKKQEAYWINRFSDEITVLDLPTDYIRPAVQSFEGDSITFKIDNDIVNELEKVQRKTGTTTYMILLSCIDILLSKYSGQEDIIVGSPIAGRNHVDLQSIVGMFVNTLAMRNNSNGNKTYKEFLKEVKDNALKAYENQDYQFEELVDKLGIKRDISRNPLFNVMFTMQNLDIKNIDVQGISIKEQEVRFDHSKVDLSFTAAQLNNECIINLQYCTKLFKRSTIEQMIEHLRNILKYVAGNIDVKIKDIDMLTDGEKHELVNKFNNTYLDYPKNTTIHELFEKQAIKTPNNIAIIYEEKNLKYKEVNERANYLAKVLRNKGVVSNTIVCIMAERSPEMIIGVLAILKAGGAYLPIDPNYPIDRINSMIKDSGTKLLLLQNKLKNTIDFHGEVILLDEKEVDGRHEHNLTNINKCNDIAYLIYTSGTTGNAKGILTKHKNVIRYINSFHDVFKLNENDITLQLSSFTFDAFVEEVYGILSCGGSIVIPKDDEVKDPLSISKLINENKITILFCSPLLLTQFNNMKPMESVHTFVSSSDILKKDYFNNVIKFANVYNLYGPTETTVCATCFKCNIDNDVYVGKPLKNYRVYIFDKYNKLVPIGVPGEVYIGGDGIDECYLNNDKLNKEKFMNDPFIAGQKIYKTGDLACWMIDGNVKYIERIDSMVKIRGFRVELKEVENALISHRHIKEVIVLDKEDENGVKYLCSYFVSNKKLTVGELREHLDNKLPEYMIPSYFIQLDKIPLTINGKVDRRKLPMSGEIYIGNYKKAPRNKKEEKLVDMFKKLLKVEDVGINYNFFELGGNSLKATALVSNIYRELNIRVPLKEVFKTPTIEGISRYIEKSQEITFREIEKVERKEYYKTSSAQKRMYMVQHFDLKSVAYNIPITVELEGIIDTKRIEDAINKLIERHEVLRTSFEIVDRNIVQRVNDNLNLQISYMNESSSDINNIINEFVRPFDLSKAPLFRVLVCKLEKERHIVIFDIHHVIADGTSIRILLKEFAEIYSNKELNSLRIQYKDFSEWQNNLMKSGEIKKQEEYWLSRFSGNIPLLNLPTDYIRPDVYRFKGDRVKFSIDDELLTNLRKITDETGTTLFMVILASINILLAKYSNQDDIIVGAPNAGRVHPELEGVIGMFANTLAMRNFPTENKSFKQFLNEVKENSLNAYENQEYQLEELIDKLKITRSSNRNPLFNVTFTMQNMDAMEQEIDGLKIKPYDFNVDSSKFDLAFYAIEDHGNINLLLNYCSDLFSRETMEILTQDLISIFKQVITNKEIKLSDIKVLISDRESHVQNKRIIEQTNYMEVSYELEESENQTQDIPNAIDIQNKLLKIWKEILGIEEIKIKDNFFELGGNSFKSTLIISEINKLFGVEISVIDLFQNLTIEQLTKCIVVAITNNTTSDNNTNVILLKKGENKNNNIFFIHDVSGEINSYAKFCNSLDLNIDINYWGIKADIMKGYSPTKISIYEIARQYIGKIKSIQPNGPYFIAGWSMGGIIAFEIVRQLEEMNENIGYLAIIDSSHPQLKIDVNMIEEEVTVSSEKSLINRYIEFNDIVKEKIENIDNMEQLWNFIIEYVEKRDLRGRIVREFKKNIPQNIHRAIPNFEMCNMRELIYHLNTIRTLRYAKTFYMPISKVNTQINLFRAAEEQFLDESKWKLFSHKQIKSYEIKGTHYSIFNEPNISEFTKKFKNSFEEQNLK